MGRIPLTEQCSPQLTGQTDHFHNEESFVVEKLEKPVHAKSFRAAYIGIRIVVCK
jgi:hypothetical protein